MSVSIFELTLRYHFRRVDLTIREEATEEVRPCGSCGQSIPKATFREIISSKGEKEDQYDHASVSLGLCHPCLHIQLTKEFQDRCEDAVRKELSDDLASRRRRKK